MSSRRKYVSLSIENKMKAIDRINNGEKIKDVAESFQIKANTLSTIYKNREIIRTNFHGNLQRKSFKRIRNGKHNCVEQAMITFVNQARNHNFPINGTLIQEKAKQLSQKMEIKDFCASSGWLQRFKKRNGIRWKCLTGNAAEVDKNIANEWLENALQPLLLLYNENDIFNADEAGLFYKCLPGKTMAFKNDKCQNGKYSKDRITLMVCTNMSGSEKLKPLIIGRSKKPRCFKKIKSLPVHYENNIKAWMNCNLFEKWIMELDKRFTQEKRKVLLFVDNCSAHGKSVKEKLISIRLEFFPPNVTSILQPMDMGIIRTIKVYYRHAIVRNLLNLMDQNKPNEQINLLDAINIVSNVWDTKINSTIIKNCFRKAGFVDLSVGKEDNVPLQNFFEAEHDYEAFRVLMPESITCTFEDYVDMDEDVMVGDLMTDEDIIENVLGNNKSYEEVVDQDYQDNQCECNNIDPPKKINKHEAINCVATLRLALEQTQDVPDKYFTFLNELQEFVNNNGCQ